VTSHVEPLSAWGTCSSIGEVGSSIVLVSVVRRGGGEKRKREKESMQRERKKESVQRESRYREKEREQREREREGAERENWLTGPVAGQLSQL
jgi:hypothetical protein